MVTIESPPNNQTIGQVVKMPTEYNLNEITPDYTMKTVHTNMPNHNVKGVLNMMLNCDEGLESTAFHIRHLFQRRLADVGGRPDTRPDNMATAPVLRLDYTSI